MRVSGKSYLGPLEPPEPPFAHEESRRAGLRGAEGCGTTGFDHGPQGHEQERQQPLETEKGKGTDCSREQKRSSPCDIEPSSDSDFIYNT